MKPEAQARQQISALLTQAGWVVQEYDRFNLSAARGVAIAEFPLSTGPTDYLLVVDRQAVGVVEAKKVGETLTGKEFEQYITPNDGRKFTELYNVQHLQSTHIGPYVRV